MPGWTAPTLFGAKEKDEGPARPPAAEGKKEETILEHFLESSAAVGEALKHRVADAEHRVEEAVEEGVHAVQARADAIWERVVASFNDKKEHYMQFLEKYMKIKLRGKVIVLLGMVPAFIKQQLADPYMPKFIERSIHRGIDNIWPDIKAELLWEVQNYLDGDDEKYEQEIELGPKPGCFRAYFRYHLFPYDKGIWYCLRDPVFVIINIMALMPHMGLYVYVFLFIFLIIDKSDEYQLIYFILSFKGAQFFSWGLLKGIVGFTSYFKCVTFPAVDTIFERIDNDDAPAVNQTILRPDPKSCEREGPGMSELQYITIFSWILPLALTWICVFLLPWSKEKGRGVLKTFDNDKEVLEIGGGDEIGARKSEAVDASDLSQGGYIRRMLYFDLLVFIFCIVLFTVIFYLQPNLGASVSTIDILANWQNAHWQVKQTLYYCQFIYGLSSIVFVPFIIPFLQAVLTHSVPTAYNDRGQCCRFKGATAVQKPGASQRSVASGASKGSSSKPLLAPFSMFQDHEREGMMVNFSHIATGKEWDMSIMHRAGAKREDPGGEAKKGMDLA